MKKVTLKMVKHWIGNEPNEAIKVLQEIANSNSEKEPWTPNILYNDIIKTWDIETKGE
tara:strand:- start:2350 stop:2523 length:174 start_codon:yes stop_codon:yes gene_type:complete